MMMHQLTYLPRACMHPPVSSAPASTHRLPVQGALAGGQAAFTVKSAEIHHDILAALVAKLASHGMAQQHALPALVPAGHILLLPGTYTLQATYSGDNAYAPATATIPLTIPAACGLVDLYL